MDKDGNPARVRSENFYSEEQIFLHRRVEKQLRKGLVGQQAHSKRMEILNHELGN
jgi:hypothetical protein